MKIRNILLGAVALLGVVLCGIVVAAMFQPTEYRIARTRTMQIPDSVVYAHISDFHHWSPWLPWGRNDKTMQYSYSGNETGVGAAMSWTSENSGNGSMTMKIAEQNRKAWYELTFVDFDSKSMGGFELERTTEGTKVVWAMEGKHNFTEKVFWMLFGVKGSIEKDFDQGLANLQEVASQARPE
jgi:hypothetical protein